MSSQPFTAHIAGNPNVPTIKLANVRNGPGTGAQFTILFKADIPLRDLPILEVQYDAAQTTLDGKVFQWFKLGFPNNNAGWVRDDLLQIVGDGTQFGYPILNTATYAFSVKRNFTILPPGQTAAPLMQPVTPIPQAPAAAPQITVTVDAPPATTIEVSVTTSNSDVPPVVVVQPAETVSSTPAAPTVPVAAPATPGVVQGIVIGKTGVNVRAAPVGGNVTGRLNFKDVVTISGGLPQGGTSNYIWAMVSSSSGLAGFVRNDYLSIKGDGMAWGLSKGDEYPAPMRNYWWVRGFNRNQNPGEFEHWGWDFGADVGEPMLAGPTGGLVVKTLRCRKCTPDRPSTISQGIALGNASVLQDEGWGFGYGNYVIIRYLNQQLPESTRQRLAARGLGNHHLYALYGHLNDFFVQQGQQVAGSQPFGGCGNTGNSEASHLHLELRASLNPNDQNFSAMMPTLMDPGVLFLR